MFRIQKSEDHGLALFTLSGQIEGEQVPKLQELIRTEATGAGITIDLGEVTLADRETVRFLSACEAQGIALKNCPPYIREWIETGRESHEL